MTYTLVRPLLDASKHRLGTTRLQRPPPQPYSNTGTQVNFILVPFYIVIS
jgi:hypothetical protein